MYRCDKNARARGQKKGSSGVQELVCPSRACVVAARQTRAHRTRYDPSKAFRVIDRALRLNTRALRLWVAENHGFVRGVRGRTKSESRLVAATAASCEFDYTRIWAHVMR